MMYASMLIIIIIIIFEMFVNDKYVFIWGIFQAFSQESQDANHLLWIGGNRESIMFFLRFGILQLIEISIKYPACLSTFSFPSLCTHVDTYWRLIFGALH